MAPRRPAPADLPLRVSNDGGATHSSAAIPYGFYDASRPPTIASVSPAAAVLGRGVTVAAGGTNFAPPRGLHCALRARADGPTLQQVEARFESNHEVLCDLASPAAAGTYLLSVDREGAVDGTTAQLTFYDREVPPFLYSLDPPEGRCGAPGQRVLVVGRNFAPTGPESLLCAFKIGYAREHVPATFVNATHVYCPVPVRTTAEDGASLTVTAHVSVAHDGMSYRQSNLQFTYASGCYPATSTTVSALIILALLALAAALVWVDRKRKEQIRETMSLLQELTAEERSWDAPGAEYERPRDIGRIPGLGLPPRGARSGYARLQ